MGASPRKSEPVSSLRITEIFHSLQGEARTAGKPTTFVRLTGCPLRCQYCDTAYAFSGGTLMAVADVVERVAAFPARRVTVTGGEPLAQATVHALMTALADDGYEVSLETGGAIDISAVDRRVSIVMDLKTPGSNECERNRYANIDHLAAKDQVKFVICDAADYAWAKEQCDTWRLTERVGEVLFSPSASEMSPAALADWILRDGLDVRFQVQLHKVLWGDTPGR